MAEPKEGVQHFDWLGAGLPVACADASWAAGRWGRQASMPRWRAFLPSL